MNLATGPTQFNNLEDYGHSTSHEVIVHSIAVIDKYGTVTRRTNLTATSQPTTKCTTTY